MWVMSYKGTSIGSHRPRIDKTTNRPNLPNAYSLNETIVWMVGEGTSIDVYLELLI